MTVTLAASGTLPATVTTEHSLAALEAIGEYQLVVDTVNMVAGDVVELRIKKAVLTGGTVRVAQFMAYYGPQPTDDVIKISCKVPHNLTDTDSITFTLKQTFGTSRNFPWSVLQHDNGANVTAWLGTAAATPTVAGVPEVDLTHVAGATTSVSVLATNVASTNTIVSSTGVAIPAATIDQIVDEVWDEDATAHQTQGTFGRTIGDQVADTDSIWSLANTNLDATVSSRLATASYTAPPSAAVVADAVWDEDATAHQTQGTFGQAIGDPVADTNTLYKAVVTDATGATLGIDVTAILDDTGTTGVVSVTGAVGSVTGNVGGNVVGSVGTIASGGISSASFALGAITANVIAADAIGASELAADAVTEIATAVAAPSAATIADAVWDELSTGHTTAGKAGEQLWTDVDAILVDTGTTLDGRLPAALVGGRMDSSVGAMATDVITSSALASSAVTEINTGIATSAAQTTAQTDLDDIQARLPAALVGGKMDAVASVTLGTDAITSATLAASAITEIQSGLATSAAQTTAQSDLDDIQARLPTALVGGRIDANVGAMNASVITATAVATDAIDSDAIAASAVTELQSGLATSAALATVQADTDNIQTRLPAALVGGKMDAAVSGVTLGTDAITSDTLANSAITEIQTGLATAAAVSTLQTSVNDLPTNAELAASQSSADDATLAAIAALNNLSLAQVNAEVDTALADYDAPTNAELVARTLPAAQYATAASQTTLQSSVDDVPTNAELATALAAADDAVLAAIAALNNLSAAQVNAQVVDVLRVDTFAELPATPAANAPLADKLGWLFMFARNRLEQTATTLTLRADDGATAVATATVSDNTITATRGEFS